MPKKEQNKIKQNIKQNKKKLTNSKKRKLEIIGFSSSIVLLLLILFIVLQINTNAKSDSNKLLNKFNDFYNSSESSVIFYYDSSNEKMLNLSSYELSYLTQIKKDYKIDFLAIDKFVLSAKNRENIELKLGISGDKPTTAIVKNKKIIAVQEGFIESHKLVKLFIDAKLLDVDARYSEIDNLTFIGYDEYLNLLDSEGKNIVVIGQSGCQYCISIKPIVNNISKAYKVNINYMDITDLDKDEAKNFFDNLPDLGYDEKSLIDEGNFNLPTMLLIEDGRIVSYLPEAKTLEEYIKYLMSNEFIE